MVDAPCGTCAPISAQQRKKKSQFYVQGQQVREVSHFGPQIALLQHFVGLRKPIAATNSLEEQTIERHNYALAPRRVVGIGQVRSRAHVHAGIVNNTTHSGTLDLGHVLSTTEQNLRLQRARASGHGAQRWQALVKLVPLPATQQPLQYHELFLICGCCSCRNRERDRVRSGWLCRRSSSLLCTLD